MAFNPYGQQRAVYISNYQVFGDGASHPASGVYGSIGALRTVYPFATALTNELNWLSWQQAIYDAGTVGAELKGDYGTFLMTNANSALDGSGTLYLGDYSDHINAGAGNPIVIVGEGSGGYQQTILYWANDLGQPANTAFTGFIDNGAGGGSPSGVAGTILTITTTPSNPVIPGMWVGGGSVNSSTRVLWQITGSQGSSGTYQVGFTNNVGSTSLVGSFQSHCNFSGRRVAVQCGNYNDVLNSVYGGIRDLWIAGPGSGSTLGVSSVSMMGLATADRMSLTRVRCGGTLTNNSGFYAGVNLQGGQTRWQEVYCQQNYAGVYAQNQTQQFGDIHYDRCGFDVNRKCGWLCSPDFYPATSVFTKCTFDAQPYGLFKQSLYDDLSVGGTGNSYAIAYDCQFIECQFENIGNAWMGDGLPLAGVTFTAGISTTTMTVTAHGGSLPVLAPGIRVQGAATNTVVQLQLTSTEVGGALGGAGTYQVTPSQTVAPGTTLTTLRGSMIYNTKLSGCEFLWGGLGGGSFPGGFAQIAADPALGIIQLYQAIGLYIEQPITTFAWTPGVDCLFEIQVIAGGTVGSVTPQQGMTISGDMSALLQNCITANKGFLGSAGYAAPNGTSIENQRYWTAEASLAYGCVSTPAGSVILANTGSTPTLSGGTPADNVQGILLAAGMEWGLVAYSGTVNVASGGHVISAGQYVRTAASGQCMAASGANDTTSKIIGIAEGNSSGGLTAVRLQGLR